VQPDVAELHLLPVVGPALSAGFRWVTAAVRLGSAVEESGDGQVIGRSVAVASVAVVPGGGVQMPTGSTALFFFENFGSRGLAGKFGVES
jgi:hypothetical protein